MKYANRLTDEELKELYQLFTDSDATIKELNITRGDDSVAIEGQIEIPEYEEELLKENPNATIITDDDYEIDDYNVKVFHHSGNCNLDYRKWMYEKFGDNQNDISMLGATPNSYLFLMKIDKPEKNR